MSKSLLLISKQPDDKTLAAQVAMTSGLDFHAVQEPAEAIDDISQKNASAIFVDVSSEEQYQTFESMIQNTVGLFSDQVNTNTIYFLSSKDLEEAEYLIKSPLFGSFILKNYEDLQKAGEYLGKIVKANLSSRAFGLKNLMSSQAKIQTAQLKRSGQKKSAVEAVKNYLLSAKFQTRIASTISNAVDEILMNAIFDAPVDKFGKQLYLTTPRTTDLELKDKQLVEMQIGYDETYVGIMAIDLYGSLDKNRLLTHISKIYRDDEYKIRTTVAGSGIGLSTVFRSGGSLFFACEAGERTEVSVLFRRTESFRLFKNQFRFLSTQYYF